MPQGKILRLVLLSPAVAHWSFDGWMISEDTKTTDTGLGVYFVDLPTGELPVGSRVCFTFYWSEANKWEGADFEVVIKAEETETKASSVIDHTLAPLV
jgi:glucoamylase